MRTKLFSIRVLVVFTAILTACQNKRTASWNELPEVTSLDSFKNTSFVATLEDSIAQNKNIIYAPAFLYAWEKLKTKIDTPIVVPENPSMELKCLMNSKSYLNSLDEPEYEASAEIVDRVVIARAFFNKTLPFETEMISHETPLKFKNTEVASFGMFHYKEDIAKSIEILNFKNDDNFILRLTPKDTNHHIYLWKGDRKSNSLSDAIAKLNATVNTGKEERLVRGNAWKYQLQSADSIAIPKIRFNIETKYKTLEGQAIPTRKRPDLFIEVAYQRTGFILNEKGAVVESEVIITATDSAHTEPPRTKKMIFDKPFLIVIKKMDSTNPYFVMKVENAELMERFRK